MERKKEEESKSKEGKSSKEENRKGEGRKGEKGRETTITLKYGSKRVFSGLFVCSHHLRACLSTIG